MLLRHDSSFVLSIRHIYSHRLEYDCVLNMSIITIDKGVIMIKTFNRVAIYFLGLFLITVGVNLSIISNLGISPISALNLPISLVLGIDFGTMTIIAYSSFVLIQMILLKDKFKKKNLLQAVFSFAFGYFVNLTGQMLSFITPHSYFEQFALMLLGVVICAIGASMYIVMDIVPNAPEGLNLAISERFRMPFSKAKTINDVVFVLIGFLIAVLFLDGVTIVREGTLVSALITGKIIGVILKYVEAPLKAIAFKREDEISTKENTELAA